MIIKFNNQLSLGDWEDASGGLHHRRDMSNHLSVVYVWQFSTRIGKGFHEPISFLEKHFNYDNMPNNLSDAKKYMDDFLVRMSQLKMFW